MSTFLYRDSELQINSSLILCVEEHDNEKDKNSIDNRIFIGYSSKDNAYVLRGKRQDTLTRNFVPYGFYCDSANDVFDFLEFVLGKKDNVSVVLYNFNNLDNKDSDSFIYEFFEEQMDTSYEIAAYDNMQLNRKRMVKKIKMLKNLYNFEKN
jgi:hypothetical protein